LEAGNMLGFLGVWKPYQTYVGGNHYQYHYQFYKSNHIKPTSGMSWNMAESWTLVTLAEIEDIENSWDFTIKHQKERTLYNMGDLKLNYQNWEKGDLATKFGIYGDVICLIWPFKMTDQHGYKPRWGCR
jgi:hypothetical protein